MGNSEVGHLNLGAGRVVMQDLVRIERCRSRDGSFFENRDVRRGIARRRKSRAAPLHLMGLIGNGGVHAIDKHLFALIDLCCEREGVARVAIHALLDGRDTMPRSGLGYMQRARRPGRAGARDVASVGRALLRHGPRHRWERTEKWYDAVGARASGPHGTDPLEVDPRAYDRARRTSSSRRRVIARATARPWRRCATATASDLLQLPRRIACARSCARSCSRTSTDFDVSRPAAPDARDDDAVRPDVRRVRVAFPPQSMANIVARSGVAGGDAHVPNGGNREVRARDVLLQRRHRDAVSRRGAICSSRARRSRRTTSCRR